MFRGAGNSFFSTAEFNASVSASSPSLTNGRRTYLQYCLRILRNVCLADSTGAVRNNLSSQGALVSLITYLGRRLPDPSDAVEIQIRTDVLQVISALCDCSSDSKVGLFSNNTDVISCDCRTRSATAESWR
jgi:hypothetical protein